MPFTLAHPAAVLPFRRFCPRYLSFPALIAGSVSPDLSYFFGRLNLGPFAHHPIKGFLFGIPAGLLVFVAFYLFRRPALNLLSSRYREIFQPLLVHSVGTPLVILLSLVIGVATHILWDNFTHNHSWLVRHFALLQTPLFQIRLPVPSAGAHTVRVVHVLSYICSFLGVFWLCLAYSRWRATEPPSVQWRNSVFIGALVFPITAIHHLGHSLLVLFIVGILCVLLILVAVLRVAKPINAHRSANDNLQQQT
jgi:hypothetical protein